MSSTDSKVSKIQSNFQALSEIAPSINSASDELTKIVGKLDEALKKLNLGLTAWVTFEDRLPNVDFPYDCDQIGYCKVNGKWGISLRKIWGHDWDDHNEEGPWEFSEAPREMRMRSVDKIPELIESLNEKASETTKKIREKTKEVGELALAIEEAGKAKLPAKHPVVDGKIVLKDPQRIADLMRKTKTTGTVAVPGGESPADKDSSVDQIRKSIGKNVEGSK